jgi:hypothetical protein
MSSITNLTPTQLRQAANLKDQIATLEKQLSQLLGSPFKPASKPAAKLAAAPKKKGGMSAAGRARIAAAQKARWAKVKGTKPAAKPAVSPAPKKRGGMSAEGRARIAAAAKARWAKVKAAGKKSL